MKTLDHTSSTNGLLLVCGTLVLSALIAGMGGQPAQPIVQPTPALPILIVATPVPTAQPTPDTAMQREIEVLRARIAQLEAERSVSAPAAPQQAEPVNL
jgi:hypothetical protein